MNLSALAKAIRDKILNDADIAARCIALYGVRHRVFYAAAGLQAPAQEECPAFTVHPLNRSYSKTGQNQTFSVRIGLTILQAAPIEGEYGAELTGPTETEDLFNIVVPKIRAISGNFRLEEADLEIGTIDEYPILGSDLTLSIAVANLIGAELTL